jgi:hypothetical protein
VQEDTMGLLVNTGKNGQYIWSSTTNSPGKLIYNKGTTKRYRTLGTIFGEFQIVKGLNFRSSVNLDNTDNNASTTYVSYLTAGTQAARTFTGSNNLLAATSGTYNSYRRQTFVNENTLNYNQSF